ncbi:MULTISPECIES: hypothetical protein [Roseicyclus]|jgi:hypothetical protein|uniref:Uncharacterized protein n=1 Tax=Roseicyclus marinus TaxID=2161673 RepID=A0AA48H168_9RHOB|nr:hypothetical protein MACH21_08560 [Roseicyclus marinus]
MMGMKLGEGHDSGAAINLRSELRARIGVMLKDGIPKDPEAFHVFLRKARAGEHFCYGHSAGPLPTSTKALARLFYEKGYVALVQKREGAVTYYLAQRTSRPFAG